MPKRKKQARRTEHVAAENDPRGQARQRDSTRPFWITAVLITAVVCGVYGQSLDAPFIFDDFSAIVTNRSITGLLPLVGDEVNPGPLNPPAFLPTSARPVVNLSFAVNYAIGGLDRSGYRVVNMVLHILSAMLLCAIVRRTLELPRLGMSVQPASWLASAVAFLWALHPLQTETVIYATQRTELMMALFYLATLYGSLRYWASLTQGARRGWLALAVLACAAGMMSKEVMVSAPLMVLLFERTFVAGSLGKAIRGSWPLHAGLFATWAILVFFHASNPHGDVAGFKVDVSLWSWWLTQAKVVLLYLRLAFWPWPLQVHYDMPLFESLAVAWPYVLVVAAIGLTTLVLLWRNHPAGYPGACVFIILSPTSLVPILTEIAAERRMYLPLAALIALVVAGAYRLADRLLDRLNRRNRNHRLFRTPLQAAGVPIALVAVAFTALSALRIAEYQQPIPLWLDVVRRQPENHMAYQNVGGELVRAGHPQDAIEWYRRAIEIKPTATPAHYNLGLIFLRIGDTDQAIAEFRETIRQEPRVAQHRNNLGAAYAKAGKYGEAIEHFRKAFELDPNMWLAHDNLGDTLTRTGRLHDAIAHYQRALEINPQALDVYGHLADAYARSGQPANALATAERALKLAHERGNESVARTITSQLEAFHRGLTRDDAARQRAPEPAPAPN